MSNNSRAPARRGGSSVPAGVRKIGCNRQPVPALGGACDEIIGLAAEHTGPGSWDVARPRGRVFSCTAYGPGLDGHGLDSIPQRGWWRKIILDYGGGAGRGRAVLVYLAEPADRSELPELLWELQTSAGKYGFRVTVCTADGGMTEAPPIDLGHRRKGGRR